MKRRTYLAGTALAGTAATAGCLGSLFSSGPQAPPVVENRPDAVYVPSHVEGMSMVSVADAGDYKVSLSYSYPHRFWLMDGQRTNKVSLKDSDSVHLMAAAWDPETEVVPPVGSVAVTASKGGSQVASKPMWPMLSQNMGFHFGDNVSLEGNGTYEVEVTVDPLQARTTGDFDGKFGSSATATFDFEFSQSKLNELKFKEFGEDKRGKRGRLEKLKMMRPLSTTPSRSALPGQFLGKGTSGDAAVLVTKLDQPPAGVDAEGPYLAVSPRTPYHGYPLPLASVGATVRRDGSAVTDEPVPLVGTLDPDLRYHYGAALPDLQSGDEVTVQFQLPPQVARHEGYETAFLDMADVTVSVP